MAIRSLSDVNAAYDNGRVHLQRFYKGVNATTGGAHWIDWSYAAGQPAFDARIGLSGQFNPFVAVNNDAIYFPAVSAGQTRHLANIHLRILAGAVGQTQCDGIVYDLLGVYPLIDGDSTDLQSFTNVSTLPRYTDGVGVFPVLVNHIAPQQAAATGTLYYTDTAGAAKSSSFGMSLGAVGNVVSNVTAAGSAAPLSLPLASGSKGCLNATGIQFSTAPGGLFSLYLYKPLTTIANHDGSTGDANKIYTEKCLATQNGWSMPRIYDGAHLGFFFRPNTSTLASVFGYMEFIWG